MPTEREKMLAGELYDPLDGDLVAAREIARDLCQDLNATRERDLRRSGVRSLRRRGGARQYGRLDSNDLGAHATMRAGPLSGQAYVTLVGLSPRAERLWSDLPRTGPVALVVGEERVGLSPELSRLCSITVRLPMVGRADSLNVAVAASIMIYELMRRSAVAE